MTDRYPETLARPVQEEIHGQTIVDQFRWLEEPENQETQAWIAAQNRFTDDQLKCLPEHQEFAQLLRENMDDERLGVVQVCKNKLFYMYRAKGQNQFAIHYSFTDGREGGGTLVDPNQANELDTIALDWWYPSPGGEYLAYGLSEHGDEWSTLYVIEVKTGKRLTEAIPRTRYCSMAWKDETSFYYTRYAAVGEVAEGMENYGSKIYYHRLGTDYHHDVCIFGEGLPKESNCGVRISEDGRYLLAFIHHGWRKNELYLADLSKDLCFLPVVKELDGLFFPHFHDEYLYLLTNYTAPNYHLVRLSISSALQQRGTRPDEWEVVLPESPESVLQNLTITPDMIIADYSRHACSTLCCFDLTGHMPREVKLPELGTIDMISDPAENGDIFVLFESFNLPPSLYRLDAKTLEFSSWLTSNGGEPAEIEVQQHFYSSKDGTRVPMFILHRKGIQLNGALPTIFNGYGGFNSPSTPVYNPALFPWLSKGGVYVIANLRGGSEYGEAWHRGGAREKKQNVFDDFIYAARYLIQNGFTDSAHLGIFGRSNGGLLVGAAMTQAPELFQAVVCQVPLLDMLRYHKFLIGALWTDEYGDPDIPEEFAWLYRYSPYHHVEVGTPYPAVLFMTALADSRVHPSHAMKMTALVQQATTSGKPVLLRVESEAGHGVGKPITKLVDEQADIWSFMAWQLGLQ